MVIENCPSVAYTVVPVGRVIAKQSAFVQFGFAASQLMSVLGIRRFIRTPKQT
jgi:hypothetical protein